MRLALYVKEWRLLRFSFLTSLVMTLATFSLFTFTLPTDQSIQMQLSLLYLLFLSGPLFMLQLLRHEHKAKTVALWKMTPLPFWQLVAIKLATALSATTLLISASYSFIAVCLTQQVAMPFTYTLHDSFLIIGLAFGSLNLIVCALFAYALVRRLKFGSTVAGFLVLIAMSLLDFFLSRLSFGQQIMGFWPYPALKMNTIAIVEKLALQVHFLSVGYLLYTLTFAIPLFYAAVYVYKKSLERSL